MSNSPCEPPARGRPRSASIDNAVLGAVLELAREVGINAISMDDLAKRASVSKTSIYRRWSSKEAVVIDALQSALEPFDAPDTGALRTDLNLYLGELVNRLDHGPMNDVLPHLIEAARHDTAIQSALDDYIRFRRRPLRAIFQRAVDRGELAPTADVDVLVDATIGPFIYRRLVTHAPIDHEFVQRLLTVILPNT